MWIIADADSQRSTPPTVAEASIAALTGEDRTVWANVRSEFFATGLNRQSLDMIERAVFVLSLDHEDHPGTRERPEARGGAGRGAWGGAGRGARGVGSGEGWGTGHGEDGVSGSAGRWRKECS